MSQHQTILSLSPFVAKPFIHGSVTRVYHLNQALARHNRLVFVSRASSEAEPVDFQAEVRLSGTSRWSQIFSPAFVRSALRLIDTHSVDLILANHIWSGLHGLILSQLKNIPLVFDNHNVEYIRFKRIGNPVWHLIWVLEKLICSRADHIWCVSDVDRQALITGLRVKAEKLQVVENGVDVAGLTNHPTHKADVRTSLGLKEDEQLYLFFGSFTYPPNVEAAQIIINEIGPRLIKLGGRGKILLIGKGSAFAATSSNNQPISVEALGFAEDLTRYIKSANVLIAPLLSGSGTRFKILETLACRVPVVTTKIGAEGIDKRVCGQHLVIQDNWDAFAAAALQTAQQRLGDLPPAFAATYDWKEIAKKVSL